MSQVSAKLRRVERGYAHYCPACDQMHILYDSWAFNGDRNYILDKPEEKA